MMYYFLCRILRLQLDQKTPYFICKKSHEIFILFIKRHFINIWGFVYWWFSSSISTINSINCIVIKFINLDRSISINCINYSKQEKSELYFLYFQFFINNGHMTYKGTPSEKPERGEHRHCWPNFRLVWANSYKKI